MKGDRQMTIKIIIERHTIPGNELILSELLMQLRAEAMKTKGYISGETLRALHDSNKYIVISTWDSLEDWRAWEENEKRKEIQERIDALLRAPSAHEVYVYD
jgi:heme-degrading monooxygenase HmoA